MSKFHLNTQELIQGDFILNDINLAFVFQVNCPGCFIYGIPIMNNLHKTFNRSIGFIGVATAFEDFEYNNEESLKQLIGYGTLVGATKKYYQTNYQISNYAEKLNFPVAFDCMTSSQQFIDSKKFELICNSIPDFAKFSETDKQLILKKIKTYYDQTPIIAETFVLNQLQGTPSFVIFDRNYTILGIYFGYQNQDLLKTKLDHLLSDFS